MKIEPGQELLHYRLTEKIGEGGMGVVWKALDTTLHRDVAIKILPEGFSGEGDRLARFEREAKLLASLNHPHIAGIYGIHKLDGLSFLAMELVDGEDLQQRLARGTMPRNETLRLALQIAQAFEVAHESGVIHRDLKPANVKLSSGGQIKVLDFGLAKALSTDPSSPGASPSMSPTLTSTGTVAGMVLGTAAYMSPEQAKGKEVDRRADIWSFGVLLYEMLTGRRLFEGEGISETLAAVILKEVDFGGLPADTPQSIRRLLERCLERDPSSRLRDMGDARIAIEEALRTPSDPSRGSSTAKLRPKWIAFLPWGFAAASLLALAWIGLSGSPTPPRPPVMRFTMSIAPDQLMVAAPMPVLAVSRDGRRVAYVGRSGDERLLFLRQIHQEEATPLKGTEDATVPFFSPDGEWIGFESNGKLKKISVLGGPPITLCDARRLRGATWGTDGTIVFAPNRSGGLVRVSEAGGEPEPLTRVESTGDSLNDPSDRWPQWLPGNRVVLFTSTEDNGQFSDARIEVLDLVEKTQKTLISGGTFARFVPPEFLIYARESTVFATRFDPETLTLTGPAVPVLEGVSAVNEYGTAHLAFSDTGTLLYLSGTGMAGQERLVWTDREGVETQASAHQRDFGWVSLSPDGTQLALEIIPNNSTGGDIWVLELARDTLTRLTVDDAWDIDPLWSPDGEWIAFTSTRQSNERNLFRKRADGTDDVERLTTSERRQSIQDWSPDGSQILFLEYTEENGPDILAYHAGADPETQAVVATRFAEWSAQLSPDGRWLAYASNKSGAPEIYVCASDGAGKHTKISTSSGVVVRWAPHRDELIYRDRDGKLMSALFTIDQTGFRPALPVELIDFPAPPHSFPFAVSLDGQRFLTYKDASPDAGERREPHVVINWAEELETRVPASR